MPRKNWRVYKAPVLPLYASDFLVDTSTWTNEEVGAHIRLLCTQWVNGPLPNAVPKLSQICSLNVPDFVPIWSVIGTKYVPQPDGTIVNVKLEVVRREKAKYVATQSIRGQKGAKNRWKKEKEKRAADAIAEAEAKLWPSSSSSSSISSSSSKYSAEQVPRAENEFEFSVPEQPAIEKEIVEEKKIEPELVPPAPQEEKVFVGMPPEKPKTLHQKMVGAYWDFYDKTLDMTRPQKLINPDREFAALKNIREYLLNQCGGDEDKTILAWEYILSRDPWRSMDDYLQKQVSLQDIYRNLLRIITHHKNVRTTKKGRDKQSFNVEAVSALLGLDPEDQ